MLLGVLLVLWVIIVFAYINKSIEKDSKSLSDLFVSNFDMVSEPPKNSLLIVAKSFMRLRCVGKQWYSACQCWVTICFVHYHQFIFGSRTCHCPRFPLSLSIAILCSSIVVPYCLLKGTMYWPYIGLVSYRLWD